MDRIGPKIDIELKIVWDEALGLASRHFNGRYVKVISRDIRMYCGRFVGQSHTIHGWSLTFQSRQYNSDRKDNWGNPGRKVTHAIYIYIYKHIRLRVYNVCVKWSRWFDCNHFCVQVLLNVLILQFRSQKADSQLLQKQTFMSCLRRCSLLKALRAVRRGNVSAPCRNKLSKALFKTSRRESHVGVWIRHLSLDHSKGSER